MGTAAHISVPRGTVTSWLAVTHGWGLPMETLVITSHGSVGCGHRPSSEVLARVSWEAGSLQGLWRGASDSADPPQGRWHQVGDGSRGPACLHLALSAAGKVQAQQEMQLQRPGLGRPHAFSVSGF